MSLASKDLCYIDHIRLLLSSREVHLMNGVLDDLTVRFSELDPDDLG